MAEGPIHDQLRDEYFIRLLEPPACICQAVKLALRSGTPQGSVKQEES